MTTRERSFERSECARVGVCAHDYAGMNKSDLYQGKNGLLLLLRIDSVTEMILMLCVCVCVCLPWSVL